MIVRRTEEVTFTAGFYADAAQTIPLVAADLNQPTYQIIDPEGTTVDDGSGVLDPGGNGATFTVAWTVPDDAMLEVRENNWRIEWVFVDVNGNSREFEQAFEVHERPEERDAVEKRHGYVIPAGRNLQLINRRAASVFSMEVEVFDMNANAAIQTVRQAGGNTPEEVIDGDTVVYKDSVLAADLPDDASLLVSWYIQETAASDETVETETAVSVSRRWLMLIHALDRVIDKIKFRATDSLHSTTMEKLAALQYGLSYVNRVYPASIQWTINDLAGDFAPFVVLAAAWWIWHAEAHGSGLLNFNFSGQTVALDFDDTAVYEASMSRVRAILQEDLPNAKKGYQRAANSVGAVAGRLTSWRGGFRRAVMPQVRVLNGNVGASHVLSVLNSWGLIA